MEAAEERGQAKQDVAGSCGSGSSQSLEPWGLDDLLGGGVGVLSRALQVV